MPKSSIACGPPSPESTVIPGAYRGVSVRVVWSGLYETVTVSPLNGAAYWAFALVSHEALKPALQARAQSESGVGSLQVSTGNGKVTERFGVTCCGESVLLESATGICELAGATNTVCSLK